jgi:hypothetical protein
MPAKEVASWDKKSKRWVKMIDGKRYKRSCRQLGLPIADHTKERSRRAANDYFKTLLLQLKLDQQQRLSDEAIERINQLNRQIQWSIENRQPTLVLQSQKQSVVEHRNSDLWEDEDLTSSIAIAEQFGIQVPDDLDPTIAKHFFGDRQIWQERLRNSEPVEDEFILENQAGKFLALEEKRIIKHKTYSDLKGWITRMISANLLDNGNEIAVLSPQMDTRKINKQTVDDMYLWLKQFSTGSKAWGYFKRLVTHLVERDCCELPSNLHSKQFRFGSKKKRIKTYKKKEVVDCLSSLKPRFRLYALLALNCSMLSVDIGNLVWFVDEEFHNNNSDSICWFDPKKKLITRKRVKTENQANAPIIKYALWSETFDLLMKHKSEHEKFVLTSKANTKLWTPKKNLISRQWSEAGVAIPLKAFRSIGSNKLKTKKEYRPLVEAYLANVPSNITDSNYADVPQRAINGMLKWLGGQYGIKV